MYDVKRKINETSLSSRSQENNLLMRLVSFAALSNSCDTMGALDELTYSQLVKEGVMFNQGNDKEYPRYQVIARETIPPTSELGNIGDTEETVLLETSLRSEAYGYAQELNGTSADVQYFVRIIE